MYITINMDHGEIVTYHKNDKRVVILSIKHKYTSRHTVLQNSSQILICKIIKAI